MRALSPRACALGYDLAPLTGLWNGRPQGEDFVSELLIQYTREEIPVVFINGRKAFKYRLDEREFLRRLGPLRAQGDRLENGS